MKSLRALLLGFGLLTVCAAQLTLARESGTEKPPVKTEQSTALEAKHAAQASVAYQNLPLRFEANQGQADARVKFLSRGRNHTLFLTLNEAVLALRHAGNPAPPAMSALEYDVAGLRLPSDSESPLYLYMTWVGANPDAQVVTFTPTATGTRTGTLTITDNASGSPQTVSLTGTGANSVLTASPAMVNYAAQQVGTTSASQPVTLSNPGGTSISVTSIQASGDFAQTNNCGASVAANSSCTVNVTFIPTASGSRTGTLTITDSASNSPQIVSLTGTGTAPVIAVSANALTFAAQVLGSSASQPVTVSNTGTAAASISGITASGDFTQSNNCGTSLAVSTSCTVNVTFSPTATGTRTGTLTITDNASGSPQTVSLTGIGANAVLNVAPGALSFTAQALGSASASQPVTLSNLGLTAISVSGIQASGDFAQTNNCGASVAANSSCTINVTFTPTAAGTRTGTLTITDTASNSAQLVSLTGFGVTPSLSMSTTSLYFGTKVVGTSSPAGVVTLSNNGSVPVTISSIQTTASDYLQTNNCGTSLNAGSNCMVSVIFQPTTFGTRPGSLVITDNAAGSPQNVSFNGTGTIAETSVGWSVALGSTAVGTSVSQSFTITDVGTVPLTIGSLSIGGSNAADFSQTNTCAASINPGGFCTVTVTFTPSATGSRFTSLIIPENGGGVALGLRLSGTGN